MDFPRCALWDHLTDYLTLMPPAIVIRDWQPTDDVAALTDLLHQAYGQLARAGFRYLATYQDEATTRRRLASGHPFVAVLDGRIVGTVTLLPPRLDDPCELYRQPGVFSFGQFGVRPDLQRGGIGRLLVDHVETAARALGATQLALDTAEGATHLVQWYERLGFRFVQHVQWDVTNYRSVVMSKPLL
jgi:GNAT superfamily N-acetyltransferase